MEKFLLEEGHSKSLVRIILALEEFAMDNVIFEASDGFIYKMLAGFGIGVGHSREATTLQWALLEALVIDECEHMSSLPDLTLYFRMVDDAFIVGIGNSTQVKNLIARLNKMDPNRCITWDFSRSSLDILDLTVYTDFSYKGTGKIQTKLYKKPTNYGMQLARTSHHPTSTFHSALSGAAHQALINCTTETTYMIALLEADMGFNGRGYPLHERTKFLLLKYKYSQRQDLLDKAAKLTWNTSGNLDDPEDLVILKIPYTARTLDANTPKRLQDLKTALMKNPLVATALKDTRFLCAHMKTSNLGDLFRDD